MCICGLVESNAYKLGIFSDSIPQLLPVVSIIVIYAQSDGKWEESEKVGLKLNIQKTKIMASGPITSWEIDGGTMEIESDYFGGVPKSLQMVTAVIKLKDAYSLEEKLWST